MKKVTQLTLEWFLIIFALIGAIQVSEVKAIEDDLIEPTQAVNYQDVKIKKFAWAVQCWTFRKFSFLETLQKVKDLGIDYLQVYPGQKLGGDWQDAPFDHNMTEAQMEWVQAKLEQYGLKIVAYGVVGLGGAEQDMRKVFEFARELGIRTIATEPEFADFPLIEKMVREYDIRVAVHNHPVPSRYALPTTVHLQVQNLDVRIGSCSDTGHWMRSGVQPIEALRLLQGRIMDVHLKDSNVFGKKEACDVPFGLGKANIHDILAELSLQDYNGFLTIEHENEKEVLNPSPAIVRGLDYVKSITYYQDYQELLKKHRGKYSKHGWNHYGPGYFDLDENSGVLKSHGGMGLFWYSVKKFKDFILELDYRCSQKSTNSGIFVRVPELPASDDYIYHSLEVQIYDAGEGIHKTGAIYDAEPPNADVFKNSGEWNHYKITFKAQNIQVELNNQIIVDWSAEPRGKVKDFASEGYIGLQNHDDVSPVYFKNIVLKELN